MPFTLKCKMETGSGLMHKFLLATGVLIHITIGLQPESAVRGGRFPEAETSWFELSFATLKGSSTIHSHVPSLTSSSVKKSHCNRIYNTFNNVQFCLQPKTVLSLSFHLVLYHAVTIKFSLVQFSSKVNTLEHSENPIQQPPMEKKMTTVREVQPSTSSTASCYKG